MSDDPKCVAGCVSFYGGEKKHHKDCPYYPESLTKFNADRIEELANSVAVLEDKLAKAVEALRPFSAYVDKSSCVITMIWKDGCYQSTYTDTLEPKDFFTARATVKELTDARKD